ncbi:hypothetical protein [Roseibium sp.]|uniref:hypothetical protein n=1 Tax=Roseibium sp. TaxID=1936156 RepID=UPI003B50468D
MISKNLTVVIPAKRSASRDRGAGVSPISTQRRGAPIPDLTLFVRDNGGKARQML